MTFKLAYATLRWHEPDLEPALETLKAAGWDGWEARFPLDWMGTPRRMRDMCDRAGLPLAVLTAIGTPEDKEERVFEVNKRRMEFAAEVGCDCFMYMCALAPEGRPASPDEVKRAAEAADRWADFAAALDLEISFHIHTNQTVNSKSDMELYMQTANAARLCIDVSHAHLWGWDPCAALRHYKRQLNYVHLQEYSEVDIQDGRWFYPDWVDVHVPGHMDFPAIRETLQEIGFDRWVTACPGAPLPGADSAVQEASRSASTYAYLRKIGY